MCSGGGGGRAVCIVEGAVVYWWGRRGVFGGGREVFEWWRDMLCGTDEVKRLILWRERERECSCIGESEREGREYPLWREGGRSVHWRGREESVTTNMSSELTNDSTITETMISSETRRSQHSPDDTSRSRQVSRDRSS